jgi:alpha/beta superfamily hydrolase
MHSERIEFTGSQGDLLAARLDRPTEPARAYALFAHCFTCSKDIAAASRISRELAARGVSVLRFDFTGLGHSEGEFANTNFSSNVQDVVGAADWLRTEHEAPSLLIGHSLGGTAVLAAAANIPECKAVATIGSPADPAHVEHLLVGVRETIEQQGQAEVAIAGRRFMIRKQFLDDLASYDLEERLAGLRTSLMVMHAPGDKVVGIDNAARIFASAKHPKSFVSLDNADHLLSRSEDATYVAELLAAWSSRYLPTEG